MDPKFDVVISGIGGLFPSSSNIEEFAKHLFRQKTLLNLNEAKWLIDNEYNIKPTVGTLPGGVGKFDASFFAHNPKISYVTSSMTKLAVERSFEAIIDAGLPPQALKGTNTPVFASSGINLDESLALQVPDAYGTTYMILGQARAMNANRISYYLDLNGKSVSMDGSWTSGESILQLAAEDIQNGGTEQALVVAGNIETVPHLSYLYKRLGLVSDDGACRSFDKNASGGQQSDTCVCLLLQRADLAKRIYAYVVASKADIIAAPRMHLDIAITPSTSAIKKYISDIYSGCGVDPKNVVYLEADGSGCKSREEAQLHGLDAILGKDRTKNQPLLIGSVKSIAGNTCNASGLMAIAKLIVAMENGSMPGTIGFTAANPHINPLVDGRMKVVDRNTRIEINEKSLFASSTFGVSSTIGHVILKPHLKKKQPVDASQELPRLVIASGRSEVGLHTILMNIQSLPFDHEYIRLTHDVFSESFRGMNYLGFTIVPKSEHVSINIKEHPGKLPLWFVYTGMGSQWAGMGGQLMQIPVFADTIERLHNILLRKKLDLKHIITETGPRAFDNVMKSFVGITAIQIALTNILNALKIRPDGIVGHSLGEIGCAYADGCLTEEQTILVSWARGLASTEADLIYGRMAAIGLGYNQIKDILPPTIDVACHNSLTSCTISGPANDVEMFVKTLTDENVFARTVKTGDIAYHSRYVAPAGTLLYQYLQEVIPNPKLRSPLWSSSSVPRDQWDKPDAKMCSAWYQTNNLLGAVLFEEVLTEVPAQAILIEIAPHGLMQAILKRALPNHVHIPLTNMRASSPLHFFLQAIGQLYINGVHTNVAALYPDVEFPVSRGTPTLSTLTSWDRTESATFDPMKYFKKPPTMLIRRSDPWIKTGGQRLVAMSVLLNLARLTKMSLNKSGGFVFNDIRIRKNITVPEEKDIWVSCLQSHVGGSTEVTDDNNSLVLEIRTQERKSTKKNQTLEKPKTNAMHIRGEQMYNDLLEYEIEYSPRSRGVKDIYIQDHVWTVALTSSLDELAFVNSLIQICQYSNMQRGLPYQYPNHIQRLEVDLKMVSKEKELFVQYNSHSGQIDGPGIHIEGVEFGSLKNEQNVDGALSQLNNLQILKWGLNPLDHTFSVEDQIGVGHLDYVKLDGSKKRVMGVACRTRNSTLLHVDQSLCWPVPQSWTDDDASSVPFAYCTAIYALEVCCRIQQHDAILIHSGMSATGQAAIRIALEYNCKPILITVTHEMEKRALVNNFQQLDGNNIVCTSTESFEKKLLITNKKPRIVFSNLPGEALKASLRCLQKFNTCLVHYGQEDILQRSHIGMLSFLEKNLAFYGLTGEFLSRARLDHRQAIIQSMAKGLKTGWIRPIIGYKTYDSPSSLSLKSTQSNAKSVLNNFHHEKKYTRDCTPAKSYLVMGGSVTEWLKVVASLAKFGAKNILVSASAVDEYADLVQQRLSVLKEKFGIHVQLLAENSELALEKETNIASIDAVILIAKASSAEKIINQNLLKSKTGVFVLLTSPSQECQSFVELCEQKRKAGTQAAVVQGPLFRSSNMISSFLAGILPSYVRLFKQSQTEEMPDGIRTTLPSSIQSLTEVVDSLPSTLRVRELPTAGLRLRQSREVFPIFVLPPLGVLQPAEKKALLAFALKQHQPVILFELPEGGTIVERAKIVEDEIHRLCPIGPYNILGWTLSTSLALQVTRNIEANGQKTVTFLIDGDVQNTKKWATRESESELLYDVLRRDLKGLRLENLESAGSWPERVNISLQGMEPYPSSMRNQITAGLAYLRSYLKEISDHNPLVHQEFKGLVHVVRRSPMEAVCFPYEHVHTSTIPCPALNSNEVGTLINESAAVSTLASDDEIRRLVTAA